MTNEQYRGILIEDLKYWERALDAAEEEHAEKVIELVKDRIRTIQEKMEF